MSCHVGVKHSAFFLKKKHNLYQGIKFPHHSNEVMLSSFRPV
jgi:hypothetical protein